MYRVQGSGWAFSSAIGILGFNETGNRGPQFGRPITSPALCCVVMPACCLICIISVGTTGLCDSVSHVDHTNKTRRRLRMGTLNVPPSSKTVPVANQRYNRCLLCLCPVVT